MVDLLNSKPMKAPSELRTFLAGCIFVCTSVVGLSQPFIDPCFTSPVVGTSFTSTANVTNHDADLLRWTGSAWVGYWPMANITIPPPGSVVNTRAIWSGDGTVWTTGGEGFGLRLTTPIVSGTTYTFAFQRVSHGYGQNGTFAPILYTNTGGSFGTSYGAIPAVGTTWSNTNISFTANGASAGHTFVYFHNNVGSGLFLACNSVVLPMAFSDLRAFAVGEDVHLEWVVQDEPNYVWHVVERSVNGIDFEEVGRVPSARTVASPFTYQHTDGHASQSGAHILYYRIRSVDEEGLEALSPIVTADLVSGNAFAAEVAPNPAQAGATTLITFYADKSSHGAYEVLDMQGRIAARGAVETVAGKNALRIPLDGLAIGMYHLQLRIGPRVANVRFAVK